MANPHDSDADRVDSTPELAPKTGVEGLATAPDPAVVHKPPPTTDGFPAAGKEALPLDDRDRRYRIEGDAVEALKLMLAGLNRPATGEIPKNFSGS